ncbi:hypothetical protein KGF56_002680 [Candida oxycetoniae]|uniref:Major facilitator superfamily (MFS) profile domain-containing protein n=1 Tax=Candida oxycetoniae TaxID=497107 RepID=A0AAI9SWY4_9ASCO|nr:uncharacterized protein KGF56_002680 [Candida oxycetoniae]KAI3404488.2 hypothetical protein KGF56_002680 [Candida oxycetoniae]
MIKSFRIAKNDAEVSKYSGYLASAFSLSQFVSAVQWGKASDKYGRKPTILLGCLGTAISMIVFGFSTNFYMALIARTMMGLLNGNVSIMRTTVGEIAVAKRHQGIAFSNLSLIWSLGKAIGYYLSGKLTDVDHYRDYKRDLDEKKENGLFDKYPFAFSNIVVASLIFCFIILGWLFLEETHDDIKRKRDIGLDVGDKIRQLCRFETLDRPWHLKDESEARLMSISDEEDYEMESLNNDNSTQQAPVISKSIKVLTIHKRVYHSIHRVDEYVTIDFIDSLCYPKKEPRIDKFIYYFRDSISPVYIASNMGLCDDTF